MTGGLVYMVNKNIRLDQKTIDYYKELGKRYNKSTQEMIRQVLDAPVYDTMIPKQIITESLADIMATLDREDPKYRRIVKLIKKKVNKLWRML